MLRAGDTLDFWRVEACEADSRLRLAAEMRLPGRAWLEFAVVPTARGTLIRLTAVFDPVGLAGLLYWYLLVPAHAVVFQGMAMPPTRAAVPERRGWRRAPIP